MNLSSLLSCALRLNKESLSNCPCEVSFEFVSKQGFSHFSKAWESSIFAISGYLATNITDKNIHLYFYYILVLTSTGCSTLPVANYRTVTRARFHTNFCFHGLHATK